MYFILRHSAFLYRRRGALVIHKKKPCVLSLCLSKEKAHISKEIAEAAANEEKKITLHVKDIHSHTEYGNLVIEARLSCIVFSNYIIAHCKWNLFLFYLWIIKKKYRYKNRRMV